MKRSHLYFLLLLITVGFTACGDDEDFANPLETAEDPSELSLQFTIANDNSGTVNIRPNGRAVTAYRIFFGDNSEEPAELAPGASVDRVYEVGTYTLTLEAMGINGSVTTLTEDLTVSFLPPENLMVTIAGTSGNPLGIDVSATADLETNFEVYFGEDPAQEAVVFQEGEVVQHVYQEVGDYEVRVVALSGGTEGVEYVETVTISNPVLLPIDFENENLNIEVIGFGGAAGAVIDNPAPDAVNSSGRVGQLNKMDGSEVWAGVVMILGGPVDFSTFQKIRLKTWSPAAGIPILLKLETIDNPDIFVEVSVNTTVANAWEELIFDFSEADLSLDYQKVVIFYNFGTAGADENLYFDKIEQTDGSGSIGLPLNFESPDLEFDFEGFGSTSAEVVDNPDMNGNPSDKVGASTKAFGSETWGGVFIDLADPVDFSGGTTFELDVWPVTAGAEVLLKLENPDDPNDFIELMVPTQGSEAWETLSYDFSAVDPTSSYTRVVFFFDFGNPGDEQTYYFDNLILQ